MADLCNGCGACCDPVVLPYTRDEIQRMLPAQFEDPEMRWFVLNVLRPLTRREGLRRARYMTGVTVMSSDPRKGHRGPHENELVWSHFYECSWYDPEQRRCTNYDNRPSLCRGFPWYGDGPDPIKALPPECGYNVEVGRPVAVTITSTSKEVQ